MRQIYIILTHTGTSLSKLIKKYTKDEFSHVSIALDEELQEMYSFGRLHPYSPIWAGFVHEHIDSGTFKRFYNTKAKIYSLNVTKEQYDIVKRNIEKIEENKDKYTFNIVGLLAVGLHKKIGKENSFYCAEFVKHLIEKAQIDMKLPLIIRPEHFKNMDNLQEIYSGLLREYRQTDCDTQYLKLLIK